MGQTPEFDIIQEQLLFTLASSANLELKVLLIPLSVSDVILRLLGTSTFVPDVVLRKCT